MKAYVDTGRNGLVPVKVTKIGRRLHGALDIHYIFTTSRGGYRVGEWGVSTSERVIPRHAVRRRKYGSTIILSYSWPDECEKAGFEIVNVEEERNTWRWDWIR